MQRVTLGMPKLDTRTGGEKTLAAIKAAWHYLTMALTILLVAFIAWAVMNGDVLWKAIRYPEAVRQMQIEVVIKK